jgi:tetratricopeptide (TPR) repeat protein
MFSKGQLLKPFHFYVKIVTITLIAAGPAISQKSTQQNANPSAVDAEYKKLQQQVMSSKTTAEQHRNIIVKAREQGLLLRLVWDYHKLAKQKPTDSVIQSAFGHAFLRLVEPNFKRPITDHTAYVKTTQALYRPAHDALEKAIEGKGKKIAFCWYAIGWENISPGSENRTEGIKQLKKALEIDPHYAPAHYRLSFTYLIQGAHYNPAKALEEAESAALIEPKSAKSYYYRALSRCYLKQYKPAYQLLLKSEEIEPNSVAKWMLDLYQKKAEKEG